MHAKKKTKMRVFMKKKILIFFWTTAFLNIYSKNNVESLLEDGLKTKSGLQIPIFYSESLEESSTASSNKKLIISGSSANLILGKICVFDTCSHAPQLMLCKPDNFELNVAMFRDDLAAFECIKTIKFNCLTQKAKVQKLPPQLLNLSQGKDWLVSAYKQQIPIWLKLKCNYDLKFFLAKLQELFADLKIKPVPTNLLMISVEDCEKNTQQTPQYKLFCSSTSKKEHDFLNEYFCLIQKPAQINIFVKNFLSILNLITTNKECFLPFYKTHDVAIFFQWIQKNIRLKELLIIVLFFQLLTFTNRLSKTQLKSFLSDTSRRVLSTQNTQNKNLHGCSQGSTRQLSQHLPPPRTKTEFSA